MTQASHWELLVEEPSMEAFLRALLPRMLPSGCSFEVHSFQGKSDLLTKLEPRLRGYAKWLPQDWRIAVLVDRDDEQCLRLKQRMEDICRRAGLVSRTEANRKESSLLPSRWQLVNRIAVEELEAWYFGDWEGVRSVYPAVSETVTRRQGLRDPDAIAGGTWEAFERVMQRYGYFKTGLAKIDTARRLGAALRHDDNRSVSFNTFREALLKASA